ncbi:MAG TPA: DoxX family protein [Albidovulum sp.]|uniref:DoxX family protein n=1 Tax=Albidovulum sp. TaxID=1872424 RepID=UPI002D1B76A3|nr:DoxX family protein [Albidovulum sp.]
MRNDSEARLILPVMAPFYDRVARPMAHLGLRLMVGGLLVFEGWPKILAPFSMAIFTEDMGLYPGWLWSAILAVMQFVGGVLILLGFLTRPAALANGVMLAVTYWFHLAHPYGDVFLTADGLGAARAAGQNLFTEDGMRQLAGDGGAVFLEQVQFKAEGLSALWTVAAFWLAAFGAGNFSVDRTLLKREF